MKKLFSIFCKDGGQDLGEYALLISLIALVAVAAATLLGNRISAIFTAIAGGI